MSGTTAQTSTLSADTTATTTAGAYQITVTGTSGSTTKTTNVCAEVSTTGATCTAAGTSSGVFYVLNQTTRQIAAFSIVSGALSQVTGSPYSLAAAPTAIAIAPNGKFLYVGTAVGIYLYTINTGGGLTLANSSNVISQDVAAGMQVDSTNSWLVEASQLVSGLYAIPISTSTGLPTSGTEQSTNLPGTTVNQLVISPDNTHVFVANGNKGTADVIFAAGNAKPFGTVTNINLANSAGAAWSVAVDPLNRILYIGETAALSGTNTGGLRAFDYNTLVELVGSPYATGGLAPYAIAPTSHGSNSGTYVYIANHTVSGSSTGTIAGYTINSSGGTYTLTGFNAAVAAGITPIGLTQDSTGNYLLAIDFGGSPDLVAYTMNAGTLTSAITAATGTDPVGAVAIAAAP